MMAAAIGVALATLVSEDLACIAAGILIVRGELATSAALIACGLGIWVGDVGLWALGRTGRFAAMRSRWHARHGSSERILSVREWIDRRAPSAILASRFVPGLRLPAYVAAGAAGVSLARFSMWSAIATSVWTPILVLGSRDLTVVGDSWLPSRRWGTLFGVLAVLAALRLVRTIMIAWDSRRLTARLARWRRWEFWPMWLFYAPVGAWVAWLAVRHGGLSTITAANPGMADGGTVGESKAAILAALPADSTIPHAVIAKGEFEPRLHEALEAIETNGWAFPLILKPDVGQRGVGVRLIADVDGLRRYLSQTSARLVLQPYHPGPFEAGIFYYRFPGAVSGRILSITDKEFPEVVGDGVSTLAHLVWAHPRYRMQASLFLERHRQRRQEVIEAGGRVRLGVAGNHAQGTLFRDGSHLMTAALESRIDEIARSYSGFFVGRFDVRYGDVEEFKAGRDLAIVELNGATAESTNIYDPRATLWNAYRTLFRQWSIVFAIGAENRVRGVQPTSSSRLFRLVAAHLATRPAFGVSD
jgi:membrane protein DedA with SNARE-associated domain